MSLALLLGSDLLLHGNNPPPCFAITSFDIDAHEGISCSTMVLSGLGTPALTPGFNNYILGLTLWY